MYVPHTCSCVGLRAYGILYINKQIIDLHVSTHTHNNLSLPVKERNGIYVPYSLVLNVILDV